MVNVKRLGITRSNNGIIPIINPASLYSITEILKLELIPNVKNSQYGRGYIHRLITNKYSKDCNGVTPYLETTVHTIKPVDTRTPGSKRPLWKVEGIEIINFLQLNNVIPGK